MQCAPWAPNGPNHLGLCVVQEIMHIGRTSADHPTAVAVKSSLLSFFREVFVDTNSKQILRMLRQPKNGLWTISSTNDGKYDVAIAVVLLGEMAPLTESFDIP